MHCMTYFTGQTSVQEAPLSPILLLGGQQTTGLKLNKVQSFTQIYLMMLL